VALSRFVSRSTSADEEIATRVDRKSREENGAREWCKKAAGEREREGEGAMRGEGLPDDERGNELAQRACTVWRN